MSKHSDLDNLFLLDVMFQCINQTEKVSQSYNENPPWMFVTNSSNIYDFYIVK